MKMKYIRYKDNGVAKFVIFPGLETHRGMATKMGITDDVAIYSAGFVEFDEYGNVQCYGNSVSLKKSSHRRDTDELIQHMKSGDF